jgi:hypothetical protein
MSSSYVKEHSRKTTLWAFTMSGKTAIWLVLYLKAASFLSTMLLMVFAKQKLKSLTVSTLET